MKIRLALIDDHPVMLDGLEQLLQLEHDFKVVAKCKTVAEGIDATKTLNPDVLVLDLRLQGEDGFSVLRRLAGRNAPAVVVLTASENEEDLLQAVRLGARGVVLKATAPRTLVQCIRTVHSGGSWLTVEGRDFAERVTQRERAEKHLAERLTPREMELLPLLVSEMDSQEIARQLAVTVGTVKIHLHHLYAKLGVTGREGLIRYLRKKGY